MKIKSKIFSFIFAFLIPANLLCYDGKTEECPAINVAYTIVHQQISSIMTTIKQDIAQLHAQRDPEQKKRILKLLLLEKQSALYHYLNNLYKKNFIDETTYEGLYEYIFDSFTNMSGLILQSGKSNENS